MKKPNLALRIGTVASSLLLVTALICHQSGAFNRFWSDGTAATENDSSTSAEESELILLPSSKSFTPSSFPSSAPTPPGTFTPDPAGTPMPGAPMPGTYPGPSKDESKSK